jgi:hypothetical protein
MHGQLGSEQEASLLTEGAPMSLHKPVGVRCPNLKTDVVALQRRLIQIRKSRQTAPSGEVDDETLAAIVSLQRHFMRTPDGVVSPGGLTVKWMNAWKPKPISPQARMSNARLREAWALVSPLLPTGSYCSSGYRSREKQREILHEYFFEKKRAKILAMCGKAEYDQLTADPVAKEHRVVELVRAAGIAIAAPGRSKHERYKAIDIGGGGSLQTAQAAIIRMVARANPKVLSGYVKVESEQCVHFELK